MNDEVNKENILYSDHNTQVIKYLQSVWIKFETWKGKVGYSKALSCEIFNPVLWSKRLYVQ